MRPSYVPAARARAALKATQGSRQNAIVSVNYTGFTPQAQAAFQYAVDIWAAQLNSSVPVTIDAEFGGLGPGVLASAGPGVFWREVPGGVPGTWYPDAIANRLVGDDIEPTLADVGVTFGSGFNWYYGTDGHPPAGSYDFVSVALHEVGHGLGFVGSGTVTLGGQGRWGFGTSFPAIYDRFVINGSGQSVLDTGVFANPSTALAAQLTSSNLYFSGSAERAVNGNAPAKLWAPSAFEAGSSYSHLDEDAYDTGDVNSLMTPYLSSAEAIHDPGAIARGMFQDMGWSVNAPTCSYTATASRSLFEAAGGTGSITVTTSPGCPWSVGSLYSWITFTEPASGTGPGTVNFSVAATSSSLSRQGAINVQGQSIYVAQDGVVCTYSVSPSLVTFGASGGSASVSVSTSAPDCTFSTANGSDWIALTGAQMGTATLTISVGASGASTRAATVGIANAAVSVRQNGHATSTFDNNHDGAADVLAYNPATGSHFFAFGDPRTPGFTVGATSAWTPGWTILPGDFNGDGRGDLFFYDAATGRAIKALATGAETFTYSEFAWSTGWQITVADLNGDGNDDVFVYNPTTGRWYRCISQADGSFSFTQTGTWSPNWSIYAGDFNGDGRADLFLYNASGDANHGRYYRALSNLDETFTFLDGDVVWRNDWTITPGDYDGDGRTDLFLYRATGDWYRVFFTSSGLRFETGTWSAGWTINRGDFNGDARSDLFVYNESSGRWYVVISQADGSLAYYGDVYWSPGWKVNVTDVNVDGVADLVLYNPTDGRWFQAVTQSPGSFTFASGTWAAGLQIIAARPQVLR